MRFRKSIKILPGVKLNLSKSGISATVGIKGLSANVGSKGVYLNTGIPGTGIYNREKLVGVTERAESTREYQAETKNESYVSNEANEIVQENPLLEELDKLEYKEFKKSIKRAGGKLGMFTLDSYNIIFDILSKNETIIKATQYAGQSLGVIVVTDKAFYAVSFAIEKDTEKIVVPLDKIKSVSEAGGFLKVDLCIKTEDAEYIIKSVSSLQKVVATIQGQVWGQAIPVVK